MWGDTGCPCGARPRRGGPPVTRPRVVPGDTEPSRSHTLAHRGSFCSGPGALAQVVRKSRAPSNGSSTKLPQDGGWHQGGAGPAEGGLSAPSSTPPTRGQVTAPHRRYTLSGSPESPEARLPRGRGACHLRPSVRWASPCPALPSAFPRPPKRSSCTCLIGLWGPSRSLVSLGLRSAGQCTCSVRMSPLIKRSATQKGSRGCQAHWGIWSCRGLGQHLLGGRGRVLGSCPGHWELLFGRAWQWCILEDKGGATGRDGRPESYPESELQLEETQAFPQSSRPLCGQWSWKIYIRASPLSAQASLQPGKVAEGLVSPTSCAAG